MVKGETRKGWMGGRGRESEVGWMERRGKESEGRWMRGRGRGGRESEVGREGGSRLAGRKATGLLTKV